MFTCEIVEEIYVQHCGRDNIRYCKGIHQILKVGTSAKVDNKCFVYLIVNISHHCVSVGELISQQLL